MLTIVPDNFLHSLALAIAAAAGLSYDGSATSQIWRWSIDTQTADPASSLIITGGAAPVGVEPHAAAVQLMTRGSRMPAVMAQLQKMFDVFMGADGRAKNGLVIAAKTAAGVAEGTYELKSIEIVSRPASLGQDEKFAWMASCNFEFRFVRLG